MRLSGMGPGGLSLLQRLSKASEPAQDTLWYQMEQAGRQEQRVAARIRWSQKHRAKLKPLAPATWDWDKKAYIWEGEEIESKHLKQRESYSAGDLRAAGFKVSPKGKRPVVTRSRQRNKKILEQGQISS